MKPSEIAFLARRPKLPAKRPPRPPAPPRPKRRYSVQCGSRSIEVEAVDRSHARAEAKRVFGWRRLPARSVVKQLPEGGSA